MAKGNTVRDQLMHSSGSSAYDTISVIVPTIFYTTITSIVTTLLHDYVKNVQIQFCIEFLFLVVPIFLNVTVLADYASHVLVTSFVICVSLILLAEGGKPAKKSADITHDNITNSRSTISVISAVAILAVDFLSFPRRFAKTENFGHSLMDVGVGLFMFANGIVDGGHSNLLKSIKGCVPLLVLGTVRLLAVKQLDYHVPVSEYGVHWNFFITLAVTKLFVTLLFSVVNIQHIWINACLLMVSHEVLLECGLKKFVMSTAKRTDFVTANREGLVSSVGYLCIYLFSAYFSHVLGLKKSTDYKRMIPKFVCLSLMTLFVSRTCEKYFGISRKLANTAYCFWILFIGLFMTALFCVCAIILRHTFRDKLSLNFHPPLIFRAINYNGLAFFLVANLLTGLINILWDTLQIGNALSIVIITVYMFINCVVVCILYKKQIKLKL